MQVQIALLGSLTDHGGRITTGEERDRINGVPVACKGDLHECPIPGHGVTAILEGAPNQQTYGRYKAYVGCRTGCGARIIQGAPNFNIWVDQPALGGVTVQHMRETGQQGYDEHFALVDQDTGSPAEGVHYELRVDGQPHEGMTSADGKTDHAVNAAPENVELTAVVQQRIGLNP